MRLKVLTEPQVKPRKSESCTDRGVLVLQPDVWRKLLEPYAQQLVLNEYVEMERRRARGLPLTDTKDF